MAESYIIYTYMYKFSNKTQICLLSSRMIREAINICHCFSKEILLVRFHEMPISRLKSATLI